MKAKKLPSGRWRCRAYLGVIDGKKKFKSFTADSKRDAEYEAAAFLRNYKEYDSDHCTVAVAIDRYIAVKTPMLSPSTINGYRILQRNAYSSINDMYVDIITDRDVQAYINAYCMNHAPKTVINAYGLLRAAIGRDFSVALPSKQPAEYHIPSDDDISWMLASCDGELKKAVILASVGTLRRGEICAVEYSDIDGSMLHVHADMVKNEHGEYVIKRIPKTSSSDRYISFSEKVIAELGTGTGRIVPITPTQLSGRWNRLKKRLRIDCRFHDLRHYAASIMHALGIPDQYIMERGGWSSDSVLKAVYRNTMDKYQKKFSDQTNNYLDKLL